MRYLLLFTLLVGTTGLMSGGCADMHKKSSTAATSEVDDCPRCPGIQQAKADGICPKCGMKVKG